MKKLISSWILFTSAMAFALCAVTFSHAEDASASEKPAKEGRPDQHGPRPLGPFGLFDTDRDGTLSAAEIADAPKALLKFDKDGDGQLTSKELPRGPRPPKGKGPGGPKGDADGDMPPPPEEN